MSKLFKTFCIENRIILLESKPQDFLKKFGQTDENKEILQRFKKLKPRFQGKPEADIGYWVNRHHGLDLWDFLNNIEKDVEKQEKKKSDATLTNMVYNKNGTTVWNPLTKEQAISIGWKLENPCHWCISQRGEDNRFESYTSGGSKFYFIQMSDGYPLVVQTFPLKSKSTWLVWDKNDESMEYEGHWESEFDAEGIRGVIEDLTPEEMKKISEKQAVEQFRNWTKPIGRHPRPTDEQLNMIGQQEATDGMVRFFSMKDSDKSPSVMFSLLTSMRQASKFGIYCAMRQAVWFDDKDFAEFILKRVGSTMTQAEKNQMLSYVIEQIRGLNERYVSWAVPLLVSHGQKVDGSNSDIGGTSAFTLSMSDINLLLSHGLDVAFKNFKPSHSSITIASMQSHNSLDVFEYICKAGYLKEINEVILNKPEYLKIALKYQDSTNIIYYAMKAQQKNDVAGVKYAIDNGMNVDETSCFNLQVWKNASDVVDYLISIGASPFSGHGTGESQKKALSGMRGIVDGEKLTEYETEYLKTHHVPD